MASRRAFLNGLPEAVSPAGHQRFAGAGCESYADVLLRGAGCGAQGFYRAKDPRISDLRLAW